jgi:hypothetical protein
MLLSFPVGMFVVFYTEIGGDINFEYPISSLDFFGENDFLFPFEITLGDVFVVLWSIYVAIFAISILGPKTDFLKSLSSILTQGKLETPSNYMIAITKWFSILILASVIIDQIQQQFGITNNPPLNDNNLIQFLYVSQSPIIEEVLFRIILIGLPLFVFYSHKSSFSYFFKSLWTPNSLQISNIRNPLILISLVGVFFGFAHLMGGEAWSEGKFAQATVSGIILGWLYFRFGLICAILVHWATNYFVYSYANFISQTNNISIEASFLHPLINTLEIIFIISGIFSVAVILLNYFISRNEKQLKID